MRTAAETIAKIDQYLRHWRTPPSVHFNIRKFYTAGEWAKILPPYGGPAPEQSLEDWINRNKGYYGTWRWEQAERGVPSYHLVPVFRSPCGGMLRHDVVRSMNGVIGNATDPYDSHKLSRLIARELGKLPIIYDFLGCINATETLRGEFKAYIEASEAVGKI